jgi:CMP-N,N'-diacetyllegionaminic acid synthase
VSKQNIVAIIPARGGSKGVPGKNIKLLAGFPLIAYSIIACKLSRQIDRVIISTDSNEIANISKNYGAEIPFLRPPEISQDHSTDLEFVLHALDWFQNYENEEPDYLVHIRPTTPLREPALIDSAIEKILVDSSSTGLRSVHEIPESPYKMFGIRDGYLTGLYPDDPRPEYYNLPRQNFPPVYKPNGYVDIIKRQTIRNGASLHGSKMLAFITQTAVEVDSPEEFHYLEFEITKNKYQIYEYLRENFNPELK